MVPISLSLPLNLVNNVFDFASVPCVDFGSGAGSRSGPEIVSCLVIGPGSDSGFASGFVVGSVFNFGDVSAFGVGSRTGSEIVSGFVIDPGSVSGVVSDSCVSFVLLEY